MADIYALREEELQLDDDLSLFKGGRTLPTQYLLMVAMHDYYYCILIGASPLRHKDKVPAEGAAH